LEEPILLDPVDPDDPALLSFNLEGDAIQAPEIKEDWEKERVKFSIECYNLNSYPILVDQRKLVWSECWNLIQEYLFELNIYYSTRSAIAHQQSKEKAKQIRLMLQPDREFSAVARACILNCADDRLRGILRSQ
jgi:hypothetical protein